MDDSSHKPLALKLGIREHQQIVVIHPPTDYLNLLGPLPTNVTVVQEPSEQAGFIHLFAKDYKILSEDFPILKHKLKMDGMLWVSWPKKASLIPTDLTDNTVREVGLMNGLVDVKVCSVSQHWSGLKFVYRVKDRG